LDAYGLGQGKATDLLAISFSSHDMLGHAFGPNSREMEEITVQEDQEISRFLNTLQKKVPGGLKNVVVVLTGDHGVAPNPDWATAHRLQAGRIEEDELNNQVSAHLEKKFGKLKDESWILTGKGLHIYLNRQAAQKKEIDFSQLEAEAKTALLQDPRIAFVVTSSEVARGIFPPGIHHQQVAHSYYPKRSGDLLIIPKPYFFPGQVTASHTSGYSYDRMVPILISGSQIKTGVYSTRAEVTDIAPTLSFLTGIIPPNLSEGRVLSEILLPVHLK
jgi:predicted AlkP superfamily pyrophosphatase or phosphodiesterase